MAVVSFSVPKFPKYCHHKATGQAFILVKGKYKYLGKYASQESREAYKRLVAELAASPAATRRRHRRQGGIRLHRPGTGRRLLGILPRLLP